MKMHCSRNTYLVNKYRRLAQEADFSNDFINRCLVASTEQSLSQSGLCLNRLLAGKVITVERILKHIGALENRVLLSLSEHSSLRTPIFDFWGTKATIEFCGDSKSFHGMLRLIKPRSIDEHYMLINQRTFIGYK